MKWILIYRQRFIRPLWYIEYSKKDAKKELSERTGWTDYSGHHLENRASAFAHEIWIYRRFGTDYRSLTLAANARSGHMNRDVALKAYSTPREANPDLEEYVRKRLGITEIEYKNLLKGKKRTWRDFRTYKKRFERLRPLFYILAKKNIVPMSFYLKYCFPLESK